MNSQRLLTLDAIRGLGVLGILVANAPDFAATTMNGESLEHWPAGQGSLSHAVWMVTHILFRWKFVALFAMLFGVSNYLVGGERGDPVRGPMLRRRLAWLAVFGIIHGALIWNGDILFEYAYLGFGVAACRSWSPARLLKVGISLYLFLRLVALVGNSVGLDTRTDFYTDIAEQQVLHTAEFAGTFGSSLTANLHDWLAGLPKMLIFEWFQTWPLMLIGLALYKLGFFDGKFSAAAYRLFAGVAGVGITIQAAAAIGNLSRGNIATNYVMNEVELQLAPLISMGYASLMVMAVASPRFVWLPKLLASTGRMAFTNYLTQSLIMTVIFYGGRGFNLFGKVDRPALLGITIAVWAIQIVWSNLWLRHFETGPLEWLWRRLYQGARRDIPPISTVPA